MVVLNHELGLYNYDMFSLTVVQARPYFFGKKLFVAEDNIGQRGQQRDILPVR